jgi:thiol-disulfide isomerase/thioredoxin
MKKTMIYGAAFAALFAVSCKEHVVPIDGGDNQSEDTTYVSATVEQAEPKNFLMEELSGVRCPNCPEGAERLEELAKLNEDRIKIVTIHFGYLAVPITSGTHRSDQDLRSDNGTDVVKRIFAEQGSLPCAATDRLYGVGNESNKYFISGSNNWANAIAHMKTTNATTPINMKVTSVFNTDKSRYDITVTLHYTKPVTGSNVLNIFITENKIKEAFMYSDTPIVYNHVMRKSLTSFDGKIILDKFPAKEAGRVYTYRTSLTIDASDPNQSKWKPENMKIVAFVSAMNAEDKHVFQVQEIDLKQ